MSPDFIDEIILAQLIRTEQEPWNWRATRFLLHRTTPHFLKNAIWLSVIVWFFTFVFFLVVFLTPAFHLLIC